MLKITRLSAPADPVTRLRIEGRVVERTAPELADACRRARVDCEPVLLDLSGVAFVDADGAAVLSALMHDGMTPVGCSAFVRAILRAHEHEHADRATTDAEMRATVRRALARVPESLRLVLALRDGEGLDTATIARALALTTETVRSRLHDAREALRTLLADEG
jgi:RNA polymerase sigma factor (sigma-70 family)